MPLCRPMIDAALLAVLLAGCGEATDGRYVGTLAGEGPSPCPPTRAVLLLRGTEARFVPDEGVIVLDGTLAPGGVIAAAADRPGVRTDASGKRQPFRLGFEGRLENGRVHGAYATPRCRATVELAPG